MRAVYVAGAGETEYSRASGMTETALAVLAVRRALEDAGLRPEDVEGFTRFAQDATAPGQLAQRLGLGALRWSGEDASGGQAACAMLGHGQAAIATGRADVVVAYRSFNGRSGRRFGQPLPSAVGTAPVGLVARGDSPIGGEFSGPYGLVAPVQAFALWANAYAARYAVDGPELVAALGAVAVRERAAATENPRAMLRDRPLSPADHRASPVLSDPLRLADLCVETDGACALVLVAETKLGAGRAVRLAGVTQAVAPGYEDAYLLDSPLPPRPPDGWIPRWLRGHGLRPEQLGTIHTYDACTFNVLVDAESVGLCPYGEGWRWVQAPTVRFNPAGGHLAEAYMQGLNAALDGFRQVRGGSTSALVTGAACGSAALLVAA